MDRCSLPFATIRLPDVGTNTVASLSDSHEYVLLPHRVSKTLGYPAVSFFTVAVESPEGDHGDEGGGDEFDSAFPCQQDEQGGDQHHAPSLHPERIGCEAVDYALDEFSVLNRPVHRHFPVHRHRLRGQVRHLPVHRRWLRGRTRSGDYHPISRAVQPPDANGFGRRCVGAVARGHRGSAWLGWLRRRGLLQRRARRSIPGGGRGLRREWCRTSGSGRVSSSRPKMASSISW